MSTKTAVVLLIGDELLSGRTTDKNLPVIAQKLGEKGIAVIEARVLPDRADVIVDTLRAWSPRVDYVLTTGGIGPTHDDITAACVAQAVDRPFVRHPDAEAALRTYYKPEDINEARLSMADMPQGASLIPNPVTGAPGFFINNIFVMAGVPSIMVAMLDFVVDFLTPGAVMHSQTLTTTLMEGDMAHVLSAVQDQYPDVKIGSYPHFQGKTRGVSLVLRTTDLHRLTQATDTLQAALNALMPAP
ncbi:MAG: competence/damage-inducible protein A [Alphaproteobacteria bacterium]